MHISAVSEQLDIPPDTLRYYERVGLIPPINRTPSGLRDYSEADVSWIRYIKCMRSAGMTIEQLVKYVQLIHGGDETIEARKALLREQRAILVGRIAELQQTLSILDYKIGFYESGILPAEQVLTDVALR